MGPKLCAVSGRTGSRTRFFLLLKSVLASTSNVQEFCTGVLGLHVIILGGKRHVFLFPPCVLRCCASVRYRRADGQRTAAASGAKPTWCVMKFDAGEKTRESPMSSPNTTNLPKRETDHRLTACCVHPRAWSPAAAILSKRQSQNEVLVTPVTHVAVQATHLFV